MAVLTDLERQQVWRGLMRWWSARWDSIGLTRADVKAAVDATDDWINTNAASYNTALPLLARGVLTADQKTLLFVAVALRRMNAETLRRVFGEVD